MYGRTTASGLTADLLLNNIPALVPEGLVLPDVFRAALLPYRSADEAGRLLDRLLNDDEWLEELRIQIAASFLFFSKEHFYAAFCRLTQGNEAPAGKNEGLAGGDDKREKG